MTGPETILTLTEVARRLDSAGITWAVFAGAAAAVYGATHPLTVSSQYFGAVLDTKEFLTIFSLQ